MTKNQDTTPEIPKYHSNVAAAFPIWFLLLTLIVLIEVVSLPVTRTALATVLQ